MSDQVTLAQNLRSAARASEKRIIIKIVQDELERLRRNHYKLCFAKKVQDVPFNVVWRSFESYLVHGEFSWIPHYQLFGTTEFVGGSATVSATTNILNIGPGEKSVLAADGVLQLPTPSDQSTAITMINDYGLIHPGLRQLSTGLDGRQESTPFYISKESAVIGIAKMTPVDQVLVWLEQGIDTGTTFSTERLNAVEFDMTKMNSAISVYQQGQWSTPNPIPPDYTC